MKLLLSAEQQKIYSFSSSFRNSSNPPRVSLFFFSFIFIVSLYITVLFPCSFFLLSCARYRPSLFCMLFIYLFIYLSIYLSTNLFRSLFSLSYYYKNKNTLFVITYYHFINVILNYVYQYFLVFITTI